MDKKLQVLKEIAHNLNREGITWAVGASLLLYCKKLTSDFRDIDVLVAEEDEERAKEILLQMGTLQPAHPDALYQTKSFLEFVINEVEVDLMIGFAIVTKQGIMDCSLKPEQIVEYYDLEGETIPLQSLKLWEQYYRWMGREEKALKIREALKQ